MEPLYLEDCPKIPVNSKGWYLQGFSRAGDRTGFMLYPLRFLFDCGIRTKLNCEQIFMTHVHTDHSLELPAICNQHKLSDDQLFHVYAPSTSIKHLILLERCVAQLSFPDSEFHSDERILERAQINFHGINAGEIIPIMRRNTSADIEYEIEILPAHHTVQSVGYGLTSLKKKLKEEYVRMMADESSDKRQRVKQLEDLKKSADIDLYELIRTPEIAFFCDSSIFNLIEHEEWKVYPVIVCECTGLYLEHHKRSEEDFLQMGHTCLSQLLPVMRIHRDKRWILIHVSTAVRREEAQKVEEFLREQERLDVQICY